MVTQACEGLFQPLHLLLIIAIVLLIFGTIKFSALGKGLGEGIRKVAIWSRRIICPVGVNQAPACRVFLSGKGREPQIPTEISGCARTAPSLLGYRSRQ